MDRSLLITLAIVILGCSAVVVYKSLKASTEPTQHLEDIDFDFPYACAGYNEMLERLVEERERRQKYLEIEVERQWREQQEQQTGVRNCIEKRKRKTLLHFGIYIKKQLRLL